MIQIQVSTPNKETADKIANTLVDKEIAACVQVLGPMMSTFHWNGKIEQQEEWLCLIKTTESRYDDAEAAILRIHPYDVPEIISIPISRSFKSYHQWVLDHTDP